MTGIYIGENRVIHYRRTEEDKNKLVSYVSYNDGCKICGYDSAKHKGVVKACLDCFLKGDGLHRFKHNVSSKHLLLKRSGTCSTRPCDNPDIVIRRAIEMLESAEGFGDYDIFENNCETFAMYCKTGTRVSLQAVSKMAQFKVAYNVFTSNPLSIGSVCKAIGQISVGYKFNMLAIDQTRCEHGH